MSKSADGLVVDVDRAPSGVTVAVAGDLDLATAGQLVDRVAEVVADGAATNLTIDLAGVRFCDSAGISALVRLRKLSDERGWQLSVVNPQAPVRRVLDFAGLNEYLDVR